MTNTKMRIEMEMEGRVQDVLDSESLMNWLGQLWMMCQMCEIPVKVFLNDHPLDISLLQINMEGREPS